MKLDSGQIKKLEDFLDYIETQTYPEPVSGMHQNITAQMMTRLYEQFDLGKDARVLDVGCGQGVALRMFTDNGCDVTGITLNQEDVDFCCNEDFNVLKMDQSFLDFEEDHFDLVWSRHCLEHSIFPFFTLHGFYAVLKKGGLLYLEVPAPDTRCQHQCNPNHYSVLSKSMLIELIRRSGFSLLEAMDLDLEINGGKDKYFAFIAKKS